ncbi:YbgA family protein [Halodesulfovibrio aestuarii]|uniref:YbgA family protein n=2 Tax=Halodesulfovibrio aestuarii TaxID=126333 RepID=A0ABV4JR26_9BACT
MQTTKKIRIGISSCLLGNPVRFDGGHKKDQWLVNTLGEYVDYVPVCPEVEMGLPIPREALRLVGNPDNPRLVTNKTYQDYTTQMKEFSARRTKELEQENLCGFVFKRSSPSSGMERVKVYKDVPPEDAKKSGPPSLNGIGVFARTFMTHFPLLPVEEEGRLGDANLRENFIERIFVMQRWRAMLEQPFSLRNLVEFHTNHKLLIMSHSITHYRSMGKLVAHAKQIEPQELLQQYQTELLTALKLKATVKKHTNVLQHIAGYFKNDLSSDEKKELQEIIEQYHSELVPLIVPLTLCNHYVRKYDKQYLSSQWYLNPHPVELKLRNHV